MIPRALGTAAAAAALAGGGVLLLPTDTICGLHARADDAAALARIATIKGRPTGQPLLVLAASTEQALAMCRPPGPRQLEVLAAAWPGPFTFLLAARPGLAAAVVDARGATVAVRVPGRGDLRRLIDLAGGPLASTSANRSGEAPEAGLEAAVARFGAEVDGWWAGDPGMPPGAGAASALVDLTTEPPRVLRAGPLPLPTPGTPPGPDPARS